MKYESSFFRNEKFLQSHEAKHLTGEVSTPGTFIFRCPVVTDEAGTVCEKVMAMEQLILPQRLTHGALQQKETKVQICPVVARIWLLFLSVIKWADMSHHLDVLKGSLTQKSQLNFNIHLSFSIKFDGCCCFPESVCPDRKIYFRLSS